MSVIYQPIKALASGGMADVYIGVQYNHTGFSRLCAIKRIKGQGDTDIEFVSMFQDEAKVCQSLQHANIVQVIDFTVMDGSCALIMEFVQGVNLSSLFKKFIKSGELIPLPVALYICSEVAKGLSYVHTRRDPLTDENRNIVHRDISPSNVLISYEGEIKITDFGIAKAQDNSHKTQAGVIKGKYQYMSPEQFRAGTIDYRTDIFALGCVLWEALAGRKMFAANNEAHLLQLVMKGPPEGHLNTFNSAVSDELNAMVQRAIAIDPTERYQSAEEFAGDLATYLNSNFQRFSSLDMVSFLKDNLGAELEANRTAVKEVLETFNNSESSLSLKSNISSFPNSRAGHAQPSHGNEFAPQLGVGTQITIGSSAQGLFNITSGGGKPFIGPGGLGADGTGLNITLNLGGDKSETTQPKVERGVDLELQDDQELEVAYNPLDKPKEEPAPLGWSPIQREQTNHQNRQLTYAPTQSVDWLGRFVSAATFGSIFLFILTLVLQYYVGLDIFGDVQSLAAKLSR